MFLNEIGMIGTLNSPNWAQDTKLQQPLVEGEACHLNVHSFPSNQLGITKSQDSMILSWKPFFWFFLPVV